MAFFFGDGFDMYAVMADAVAGYWDAASLNPNSSTFITGRFSGSRGFTISNSTTLIKTSGQNDSIHHFTVSFQQSSAITGTNLGFYLELFDGTTAQCSVVFRSDGVILLTAGGPTGSLLALYSGAFPAQGVWYAFEIEVVVHNTAGSIAIRKSGNPNNDFFLGSLDTATTVNNYANKLQLGSQAVGAGNHYIDDFLWRSDAASVPWVGDIRCYTRRPASDVSVQLSRSTAPINQLAFGPINVANGFNANDCRYVQFTSSYSGLITGALVNCNISGGGGPGHLRAAIFSNSSNTIGNLLATSAEFTDPTVGMVPLTFPTPARVAAGQIYWFGLNQDANITYNVINSTSVPVNAIALTQNYATWPVSNPGGTLGTPNVYSPTLIITPGMNADCVSELLQDVFTSYVGSSVNGQADLYTIGSIAVAPANIVGVTTRGFFTKTDAGTRNASVQLKSGATTVQGPNTALNTAVWSWIARNDLVDPATGAAWTANGVNSVNIGPIVTA